MSEVTTSNPTVNATSFDGAFTIVALPLKPEEVLRGSHLCVGEVEDMRRKEVFQSIGRCVNVL